MLFSVLINLFLQDFLDVSILFRHFRHSLQTGNLFVQGINLFLERSLLALTVLHGLREALHLGFMLSDQQFAFIQFLLTLIDLPTEGGLRGLQSGTPLCQVLYL